MHEVRPVEMMVVIVRIPEIGIRIPRCVRCAGNDTAPLAFINQRKALLIRNEAREGGFEFLQSNGRNADVPRQVVYSVYSQRELAESFAAEVHAVEIGLGVHVLREFALAGAQYGGFGGGGKGLGGAR